VQLSNSSSLIEVLCAGIVIKRKKNSARERTNGTQIKLCDIGLFSSRFTVKETKVKTYKEKVSSRFVRSILVFKDLFPVSFTAPLLELMMAGYYHK